MYASHFTPSTQGAALSPFDPAPEALALGSLFTSQPVEKLAAREAAFWEGDAATHVFQVTEGCLRLYRILSDGRRAIMGFVFGGETLGLSFQDTYRYTAEAVTPVRLRRMGRNRFQATMDASAQLQPLLMAKVFEEMSAAQQHIIVLGQLGAEERVAHFLVSAASRTGADQSRPVVIDLPMTRQDIADYLGLTIETVCRVLSRFKRDGLITLDGRQQVVLRRLGELQELAGQNEDFGEPLPRQVPVQRSARRAH